MRTAFLLIMFMLHAIPGVTATLSLTPGGRVPTTPQTLYPDQLPQSHVAYATNDIAQAYLASATDRYAHGVLGDGLEAATLALKDRQGRWHRLSLPPMRVFEDLTPRLVDLDRDGRDEVILAESDAVEGASLAVYQLGDQGPVLRARSPFIGQSYRWLNPVGAGDFDGDGQLDLAAVITPHIGGVLTLYHLKGQALTPFAEENGFSTHAIGMTDLALAAVVSATPRDWLLIPNQARTKLLLLEWIDGRFSVLAEQALGGRLSGSLHPAGNRCWQTTIDSRGPVKVCLK